MLKEHHRSRRNGLEQAPPPANQKEIVISEANDLAVVFEDGRACEFLMRQGEQLVGDIILGKVESVVPAIEAAFINIGHDKNGFIHVADLPVSPLAKKKGKAPTVRSGDKLIVQIAKAPTGSKGARLTGRISVPGRYLVFVPHDNRVCISRRIVESKERERLRRIAFNLKDPGHGLIVRTEAIGASEEELRRDIDELIDRWAEILHVAQVKHAPALLYRDQDLMTRVLRDALSAETEKIILDSEEGLQRATDLLSGWMPDMVKNLQLHRSKESVMSYYKIDSELEAALKPSVRLPSGGGIVIEHTEALTCIDVNSGKLTQSKSLQDTVLRTNLEAATEIARQLRLRDIGGVIIIDFISMDYPADRQKVIRHFEEALRPDKSRPQITSQFSEHGLLEVARRRQGQSLLEQLTHPCPSCHGIGRVRNEVLSDSAIVGHAVAGADMPETLVDELIEEPLAGPEMLDSEMVLSSSRLSRTPLVAPVLGGGVYGDENDEFGEDSTEGDEGFGAAGEDQGRRRRRRRRRRGRGGEFAGAEGMPGREGGFGQGRREHSMERPTAGLAAPGKGLETPEIEPFGEFEASDEDIAAYSQDREGMTEFAAGDYGAAGEGGRRRRRRRRGRGGRDRAEGAVSSTSTEEAVTEARPQAQPAGFGRPERPGFAPRSGFGRPERSEGFGRPERSGGFASRPTEQPAPSVEYGVEEFEAVAEPAAALPEEGRREQGRNGFGRNRGRFNAPPRNTETEPASSGFGPRRAAFSRPERSGSEPAPQPTAQPRETQPAVAVSPAPSAPGALAKAAAPAKPARAFASPRTAASTTKVAPAAERPSTSQSLAERTAPYVPAATSRPQMEVREVTPGVMQLVPVGDASKVPAAKTPATRTAAKASPSPAAAVPEQALEAEAPAAAKRTTRRTTTKTKAPKAEAPAAAEPVTAPEAAEAPAQAEAKPTRRRSTTAAKATTSRSRKTSE